jgi:hypothetical protein
MKARALIAAASYGPETLKVICQAFDAAWAEIAHHFEGHPAQIDAARERLAHSVLAIADANSQDADALKSAALQVLVMTYGRKLDVRPPTTQ